MPNKEAVPVRQLILVPSVITLAVTLLRLVGELQNWSPRLFNKEPGGGGAPPPPGQRSDSGHQSLR